MMVDLHAPQSNSRRTSPPSASRAAPATSTCPDGHDADNNVGEGVGEPSASALAHLARDLHSRHSGSADTLAAISAAACELIPGAHSASIALLLGKGKVQFFAATGPHAASIDDIQRQVDDGPSLLSIRRKETVLMSDIRTESRCPKFTAVAVRHKHIRSTLSLALDTGAALLGALTVYSPQPQAFSPPEVTAAAALATHAALALAHSTHEEQLAHALASRDSIGQAKGMIMERYDTDARRAFAMLSTISQDTNTPVATLATQLTGRQPPRPNT